MGHAGGPIRLERTTLACPSGRSMLLAPRGLFVWNRLESGLTNRPPAPKPGLTNRPPSLRERAFRPIAATLAATFARRARFDRRSRLSISRPTESRAGRDWISGRRARGSSRLRRSPSDALPYELPGRPMEAREARGACRQRRPPGLTGSD